MTHLGKLALVTLSTLLVPGCAPVIYRIGEKVDMCRDFYVDPCGVYLDKCDSGLTYWCATNVEELTDEKIVEEAKENTKNYRMRHQGI